MGNLTQTDMNLLDRLPVPRVQRELVEQYLDKTKPKKVSVLKSTLSKLVVPAIIAVLSSTYFVAGMVPFANVALVAVWLLLGVMMLSYIIIMIASVICAANVDTGKNKQLFFDRSFIKFLVDRTALVQIYNVAQWLALVTLTAMLGHLMTSVFVALAWVSESFTKNFMKEVFKKNLEELAKRAVPHE